MNYTTRLIRAIHTGRNRLGLDEEEYYAIIGSVSPGKTSCKQLSVEELKLVLEQMRRVGFKPVSDSQLNKVRALWHTLADEGIVRIDTDKALSAYVQRITKKKLSICTSRDLVKVIETLKKWLFRIEDAVRRERLEEEFSRVSISLAN